MVWLMLSTMFVPLWAQQCAPETARLLGRTEEGEVRVKEDENGIGIADA
jgi:hypothetical protein